MNALDYVLFAIIALAALRCWFRGIIGEVLSMAAVVGGLLSGIFFYRPIGAWLSTLKPLGGFEVVAGFVAAFAVVFIVVKIVERSLRSVLENLNLDILDKALGLAFGALEGVVVSAIVVLALRYQPVFDSASLLEGSFVSRLLLPIVAASFPAPEAAESAAAAVSALGTA
ncbi:MAG: CvpA family protein [Spirochaetes bacterium]|nr:CvpA family protein [Spirochaetota bacterium]